MVKPGKENANQSKVRPDYRHAYPVVVLVCLMVAGALTIRHYLVPKTFGDLGFYRAAAIDDAKARQPRYVGRAACAECHDDVAAIHAKDAHSSVECETCHGPGSEHIANSDVAMIRADSKESCLVCHRMLDARPGSFPQVDWQKHFQFVGVSDTNVVCIRCHSPHEPLYMDRDLHEARLHPLVHDCGECHIGRTDTSLKQPAGHPMIFQCAYCHKDLAASFAKGAHAKVGCKTCHLFIRDTSFSGRIVRNTDPRFCLLCHRKTDFRSASGTPTIDWPSHIRDVSDDPADPKRPCVNCHQEQIHEMYSKEKLHAM